MTTKTEKADMDIKTIRNLNVNDVLVVSKIGKATQDFRDAKRKANLTVELLLLKGKIKGQDIVVKLYGSANGNDDNGEPITTKPTVSYTEVENYLNSNDLELPASVELSLTIVEDGSGQNTYKHFKELTSHIDLNKAFEE